MTSEATKNIDFHRFRRHLIFFDFDVVFLSISMSSFFIFRRHFFHHFRRLFVAFDVVVFSLSPELHSGRSEPESLCVLLHNNTRTNISCVNSGYFFVVRLSWVRLGVYVHRAVRLGPGALPLVSDFCPDLSTSAPDFPASAPTFLKPAPIFAPIRRSAPTKPLRDLLCFADWSMGAESERTEDASPSREISGRRPPKVRIFQRLFLDTYYQFSFSNIIKKVTEIREAKIRG